MTLIQIDNYGPWTVTPRPRTESDLQILQAELFADVQRLIAAKKGLVFFTRFDNLLAISNGLNEEDHLRIQRSIRNRYPPLKFLFFHRIGRFPHSEEQWLLTFELHEEFQQRRHPYL